jgi:hypothetical protein
MIEILGIVVGTIVVLAILWKLGEKAREEERDERIRLGWIKPPINPRIVRGHRFAEQEETEKEDSHPLER